MEKEYPIIANIRTRLNNDERIADHQVKDYKRRLERSDFLKVHVELLQSFHNQKVRAQKLCCEKHQEIKRLEDCLTSSKYELAEKRIIDEFGEKSYEYEVFSGLQKVDQ